jgi:hypothetical protein
MFLLLALSTSVALDNASLMAAWFAWAVMYDWGLPVWVHCTGMALYHNIPVCSREAEISVHFAVYY